MFSMLRTYLSLYFNPVKKGDVFFADAFDYICESPWENIFFPLIDRQGISTWYFLPGANTYRFTIESIGMPYYICKVEILAVSRENPHKRKWLQRSHYRRVLKKDFHRLMVEDRMIKTKSQSLFG